MRRSSSTVRGDGLWPQPGRALGGGQIAGQRNLWRVRRHLADGLADDELVDDERQPAEHGLGGVEHLGQARHGADGAGRPATSPAGTRR